MMGEEQTRAVIERLIASYGNDPDGWPAEFRPLAMGEAISAEVLQKFMSSSSQPSLAGAAAVQQAALSIGSATCAQCAIKHAKKRCSACRRVFYCSVECQKAAWPDHKRNCRKPAESAAAARSPLPSSQLMPERTGGEWDAITEQQAILALTAPEHEKLARTGSATAPHMTLLAALRAGAQDRRLKLYSNAPRYDRLLVWTTTSMGSSYVLEAGLDAWEGTCWWTTKDLTESGLQAQGLMAIGMDTLQAEYGGVLAFLETCKRLGAPRYTIRTDLDPNAKPHVIAVVERLLAASPLRFLLDEAALSRADHGLGAVH